MSLPFPHDLRVVILSYVPTDILANLNLTQNLIVDILNYRYRLPVSTIDRVMQQNTVLSPNLILVKIAVLHGDSVPRQEALYDRIFCLVNAILGNNLNTVLYYAQRVYFNGKYNILDSFLNLAIAHRVDRNIVKLLKAFIGVFHWRPAMPAMIVEDIKLYYSSDYPVYSFGDLEKPLSILQTIRCFDFAGLSQIPKGGNKYIFPSFDTLNAVLLPRQLFEDLDKFRQFIRSGFPPSKNVSFYLTLLDALGNKSVDLESIRDNNQLRSLAIVMCSVLHQQAPEIIKMVDRASIKLIPSERLYHIEYIPLWPISGTGLASVGDVMSDVSLWISRNQTSWLELPSDLEFDYENLQLNNQIKVTEAEKVKLLKSVLKPDQIIIMNPTCYVEYEAMKKLEQPGQVIFDPTLSISEMEDQRELFNKTMELYADLLSLP